MRLVAAVSDVEPVYGTWVMLCALLSARGSEVNGLLVGDVDLVTGLVHIRRQVYPGAGGLVTKQTKGRAARTVPILEPLRPVLHSRVEGRAAGDPLVRGPKGGVITTASLRRATNWNALVIGLGLAGYAATTCGTRRPGWLMPGSHCTCSRRFSGTARWRPREATRTPTPSI